MYRAKPQYNESRYLRIFRFLGIRHTIPSAFVHVQYKYQQNQLFSKNYTRSSYRLRSFDNKISHQRNKEFQEIQKLELKTVFHSVSAQSKRQIILCYIEKEHQVEKSDEEMKVPSRQKTGGNGDINTILIMIVTATSVTHPYHAQT